MTLHGRYAPDSPAAVRRYYLVYLVLDASPSMRVDLGTGEVERSGDLGNTYLGQFTRLISRMLRELSDNPVVNSLTSVGVLAFHQRPQILRPMSDLARPQVIGMPDRGPYTDYASVLRFLVAQYPRDVRAVLTERHRPDEEITTARPWVFFITDGRPYAQGRPQRDDEWLPHRNALVDGDIGARIVAIGLPNANEQALWKVASGPPGRPRNALIADGADSSSLAASIVAAIKRSITASVTSAASGNLLIDVPRGMRRATGNSHE
ncbi:vWA domain-containing protein [Micromonospora echinofusca]|uniref:VWFA domain-containing protein n=1 Tax=Micromonospora echinofusca TaxID=47858 RepID=A0ABS3VVA8_MICEH|nr:hypothetical protein [Micromonospora echinofusca]MBO4208460.1 hypothetical protein [Micromonospora echinofusca]